MIILTWGIARVHKAGASQTTRWYWSKQFTQFAIYARAWNATRIHRCCTLASIADGLPGTLTFILTVHGPGRSMSTLGTKGIAMLDVMSAMFGFLSLSIFIAHAIDAYRSRRPNTFG